MAQNEERKGMLSQIIVAVVVTLLVGGTSPWWWNKIFHKNNEINNGSGEVVINIEKLQEQLEDNENKQEKAHRLIEYSRTMLDTDPDAWRVIQEQERWLEKLTMERERMEHELGHLHKQR